MTGVIVSTGVPPTEQEPFNSQSMYVNKAPSRSAAGTPSRCALENDSPSNTLAERDEKKRDNRRRYRGRRTIHAEWRPKDSLHCAPCLDILKGIPYSSADGSVT